MAPSVSSVRPVVYRAGEGRSRTIWVESEVSALAPRLVDFDGLAYGLGAFGFIAGGLLFVLMAPRRLRLLAAAGWILICVSAIGWSRPSNDAASWLGFDRGLHARLRAWMAESILPAAPQLHPVDSSVTVGRWTPGGSRRHRLLELLGLLQPPVRLEPDFERARLAIALVARSHLAAMGTNVAGTSPAVQGHACV